MPTQERAFRTPALVLKRRDFGEADRLLTVITPRYGKFDVIAKGARKPTSSKTGHVELFTRVDMLVNRGRELHILSQVQLQEPYLPLREDLQRGAYAYYAAELLDRFTEQGEDDLRDVYDLLLATFDRICAEADPRLPLRFFEMRLLDIVGFRPELTECVITHEHIQPEDQYFSYALGGAVSPLGAVQSAAGLISVSMTTLKILRHLQRSPYEHVTSLRLADGLHADVERVMHGYLAHLLERRLQSVDFIRRIRR
jgi:DNA repair protein RecO (recombination protein O)